MISFAPYIWIWIKNLCGNLFNMNPSIVSNDWNGDSVKNYLIILYKFPGSKTAYIKLGTHGYKTFWLFLFIFVRNKILMVPKTSESQFTIIESVYIVCLSNFALYKIVQDGFVQHPIFLKDFFFFYIATLDKKRILNLLTCFSSPTSPLKIVHDFAHLFCERSETMIFIALLTPVLH